MAESDNQKFFVPWFTALVAVAAVGGVIAGGFFYDIYQMVEGDAEREETFMRFVVVSYGVAPVLLAFRWFALRGRK